MLRLENVSVSYGLIRVLRNISLEVREGEIFSIIGANGAGKTTLLRTIIGWQKCEGKIILSGEDITTIPPYIRAKKGISIVPEGRRLFPHLSIKENLLTGAYWVNPNGIAERLDEIYSLFPFMRGREEEYAGNLSGGEQQMVAIGRALMAKPKLLLLDEPSAGLMPKMVREVFRTISNLKGRTTVLLVEQNVRKALEVSDRIALLRLGQIVLEGGPESLKDDPTVQKAYLGGT
jgi:branched-chain amino acid transport system ATP-binding protein